MVSFLKAVGGLIHAYETTKRDATDDDVESASVACDVALSELDCLANAIRHLRRSLHPSHPGNGPVTRPPTSLRAITDGDATDAAPVSVDSRESCAVSAALPLDLERVGVAVRTSAPPV
jgi:hypothetical protein